MVTPLWLSHHWPADYHRCVRVGDRHVCRRCLVLYPIAFTVTGLVLAFGPPPGAAALLVALPVPAVVEFVVEHLGGVRYSPRRQVAVTVPLAVGLGVGFGRYLEAPADPLFWSVVVAYGALCLGVLLWSRRGQAGS